MTLVQSWVDSLTLLKPKNFQLFAMVTIKSIMQAYKLLVRSPYWWALILLMIMCYWAIGVPHARVQFSLILAVLTGVETAPVFLSCCLYEILFLMTIFSTRPSIFQKDSQYFIVQFRKIILFWIFMPLFSWSSAAYYGYIFTVLFFADSEGGPKNFLLSLWNALKMIIFNFPLIMILGGIIYGLGWIGGQYLAQILIARGIPVYPQWFLFVNLIGALLLPIGVCIYTNIYIKRLHDQFDLYFNKAQ